MTTGTGAPARGRGRRDVPLCEKAPDHEPQKPADGPASWGRGHTVAKGEGRVPGEEVTSQRPSQDLASSTRSSWLRRRTSGKGEAGRE
jgi:hypothetical protein